MKYYKDINNELFGIEQWQELLIQSDWTEINKEEIASINKAKEQEYKLTIEYRISEAKSHLASTDFKMTVDYFATMTPEQQTAITASRAEARAFLVANRY